MEYFHLLPFEDFCAYLERISGRRIAREYFTNFPIQFNPLIGELDRLCRSDAIVYWCDWLHTRAFYDMYKQSLLDMGIAKDGQAAIAAVDHHIYLTNSDAGVLNRTISYGQAVMHNTLLQEASPDYGAAFKSFYTRVRTVGMRDIVSARRVSKLRLERSDQDRLGIDCALFLDAKDIDGLPRVLTDDCLTPFRGGIGVFFGRCNLEDHRLLNVVNVIGAELGQRPFALPWGSSFNFPKAKALRYQSATPEGSPCLIGDQLRLIRDSSLVVSDTYHVCVNAWANGVPAICLGSTVSLENSDANNGYRFSSMDKRHVFYGMIDALDFFVHEEELRDSVFVMAHLAHIARLIKEIRPVRLIVERLRREASDAERWLVSKLDEILALSSL